MKCVNIKLWDILSSFHYILNAPRIFVSYFQNFTFNQGNIKLYEYHFDCNRLNDKDLYHFSGHFFVSCSFLLLPGYSRGKCA